MATTRPVNPSSVLTMSPTFVTPGVPTTGLANGVRGHPLGGGAGHAVAGSGSVTRRSTVSSVPARSRS